MEKKQGNIRLQQAELTRQNGSLKKRHGSFGWQKVGQGGTVDNSVLGDSKDYNVAVQCSHVSHLYLQG